MSDALFLPRELFADLPPGPGRETRAPAAPMDARPQRPTRQSTPFDSGEAVTADLIRALGRVERRRQPRPAGQRGVDFYIG